MSPGARTRCPPTTGTSSPACCRWRWVRRSTTSRWTCCSSRVAFSRSQPTLPRTAPIPDTVNVAIIGAGIAGMSVALAAAAEGVSLRDLRPQRRSRRHLVDHHLSGHRRRHAVGVLLAVAGGEPATGAATTRRARSIRPIWWHWPTSTGCASTRGSAPRSRPCGGTTDRNQWQIHSVDADGQPRRQLRQRRGHRGRLPQPSALARCLGPGNVRGHQHSLGAVGFRRWTSPARGWPSSGPAARPCRSSTRASTRWST